MTCSIPPGSSTTRRGRRSRTSGSAPAATPSGAGWRCCAGCATRAPTTRQRPARRGGGAGPLGAAAAGAGAGRPGAGRARRRRRAPTSTTSYAGSPTRRTPASTWSRSAASSRCAAASSTSSRRPRSTRCGWSSGATTSRRSAPSRSPTSARSKPVERLWAPPCRELLLTDEVRAPGRGAGREHPELRRDDRQLAEGLAVEGMESLAPVLVDEMELLVDLLPAESHVLVLDPERVRARAHDLVATSRGVPDASLGGRGRRWPGADRPRRGVATARSATSAAHALAQGKAWWSDQPVRPRRRRPSSRRARETGGGRDRRRARRRRSYRGDIERAVADIRGWLADGRRVVLLHRGTRPGAAAGRGARRARRRRRAWSTAGSTTRPPTGAAGVVTVTCGAPRPRVRRPDRAARRAHRRRPDRPARVHQGHAHGCRRGAASRSTRSSCKPGDYVVHEQHGVGRYVEMIQRDRRRVRPASTS